MQINLSRDSTNNSCPSCVVLLLLTPRDGVFLTSFDQEDVSQEIVWDFWAQTLRGLTAYSSCSLSYSVDKDIRNNETCVWSRPNGLPSATIIWLQLYERLQVRPIEEPPNQAQPTNRLERVNTIPVLSH